MSDLPRFPGSADGPRLIGIVNLTTDSFSDGGLHLAPEKALRHAHDLRAGGADIIELGPAASHPGSEPVTAAEQRERLAPVMASLAEENIPVSVDSFHPDILRFAIENGAAYLNDIQGFPCADLYPALAESECTLVVMHSIQRRGPATIVETDPAEVWAGIDRFFDRRLTELRAAGVPSERLVIDPGLGFFLGSNAEPSVAVLARIRRLRERFGLPVLVSPSRKSFLRALTGRDIAGVGPATLAAELFAASQGIDYIRTHDVEALHDALTVLRALTTEDPDGPGEG
ncbi:dihydropteroate synthase [Actinomadura sp. KC216]|uniref:dihydropteroate synthase n=1 Tax=Actinomadura sp. KC216 TaxID=2530370 RepID=UPI00104F7934|nr:dihydropteroate synthase [Actinomadura sp. KC216]TDB90693.1 dihydropteroate synthase [Actinomadura sp. KC216]